MSSTILFVPRWKLSAKRERLIVLCTTVRQRVDSPSDSRKKMRQKGQSALFTRSHSATLSTLNRWSSKGRRLLFTGKVRTLRGLIVTFLETVEQQQQKKYTNNLVWLWFVKKKSQARAAKSQPEWNKTVHKRTPRRSSSAPFRWPTSGNFFFSSSPRSSSSRIQLKCN